VVRGYAVAICDRMYGINRLGRHDWRQIPQRGVFLKQNIWSLILIVVLLNEEFPAEFPSSELEQLRSCHLSCIFDDFPFGI
jgi:hypothetical protein